MAPVAQLESDAPTRIAPPWSDAVEEILGADQAVMLCYVTPASGVVPTPVTNFGVHDRERGTITPNSSVGVWKKLERIRRNPHVALAFHTRAHSFAGRPQYVLVQGLASLTDPDPDYPASIRDNWERFQGFRDLDPFWRWWLRVWHLRVGVEVVAKRVTVWPDLGCRGKPEVHGAPVPHEPPPPQEPPSGGTGPRVDPERVAKRASHLPHVLLSWVGTDGYPVAVPVDALGSNDDGVLLRAPAALVPPGGRRAGLTAHWFARHVIGQHQRVHTG